MRINPGEEKHWFSYPFKIEKGELRVILEQRSKEGSLISRHSLLSLSENTVFPMLTPKECSYSDFLLLKAITSVEITFL